MIGKMKSTDAKWVYMDKHTLFSDNREYASKVQELKKEVEQGKQTSEAYLENIQQLKTKLASVEFTRDDLKSAVDKTRVDLKLRDDKISKLHNTVNDLNNELLLKTTSDSHYKKL